MTPVAAGHGGRDEHEEACAWVGRSQAVPLDLHQLVPVPREVPRLGRMRRRRCTGRRHWGTMWPLRRVERLPCPDDGWPVGFWSADWTPWPVMPHAGRGGPV